MSSIETFAMTIVAFQGGFHAHCAALLRIKYKNF
jgi:hypothetical protein